MTGNEPSRIGAVLLAAGGSSRLGRPKQLLRFEGESLLRRAAGTLAGSVYYPIVVVLGADQEAAAAELTGLPVHSVVNENWAEGMGTSLRCGLQCLLELEPDADAVLVTLCDQPALTTGMLDRFAYQFRNGTGPVIAAGYGGISGVPALFSKEIFDDLLRLKGDSGARHIIRERLDVCTIDLPEAAVDIDTPSDAAALLAVQS